MKRAAVLPLLSLWLLACVSGAALHEDEDTDLAERTELANQLRELAEWVKTLTPGHSRRMLMDEQRHLGGSGMLPYQSQPQQWGEATPVHPAPQTQPEWFRVLHSEPCSEVQFEWFVWGQSFNTEVQSIVQRYALHRVVQEHDRRFSVCSLPGAPAYRFFKHSSKQEIIDTLAGQHIMGFLRRNIGGQFSQYVLLPPVAEQEQAMETWDIVELSSATTESEVISILGYCMQSGHRKAISGADATTKSCTYAHRDYFFCRLRHTKVMASFGEDWVYMANVVRHLPAEPRKGLPQEAVFYALLTAEQAGTVFGAQPDQMRFPVRLDLASGWTTDGFDRTLQELRDHGFPEAGDSLELSQDQLRQFPDFQGQQRWFNSEHYSIVKLDQDIDMLSAVKMAVMMRHFANHWQPFRFLHVLHDSSRRAFLVFALIEPLPEGCEPMIRGIDEEIQPIRQVFKNQAAALLQTSNGQTFAIDPNSWATDTAVFESATNVIKGEPNSVIASIRPPADFAAYAVQPEPGQWLHYGTHSIVSIAIHEGESLESLQERAGRMAALTQYFHNNPPADPSALMPFTGLQLAFDNLDLPYLIFTFEGEGYTQPAGYDEQPAAAASADAWTAGAYTVTHVWSTTDQKIIVVDGKKAED